MSQWFSNLKTDLQERIHAILENQTPDFERIAPSLGSECLGSLAEYACRGKLIRGSLVFLGYELCGKDSSDESIRDQLLSLGAAMELLQSALLIHDDIMDRDLIRRGKPSIHAHYQKILDDAGIADSAHQGEALAICLGDIAIFSAWQVISGLGLPAPLVQELSKAASLELNRVALAQMLDVANGAAGDSPLPRSFPENDKNGEEACIKNIYRFKTGRYTFSLPLALGATAAGASKEDITALEEAGEELGIVFQVKDDELGIWADEQELGKSIGLDIRENKKTLHRLELFRELARSASDEEACSIRAVFGKQEAEAEDIQRVRTAMEKCGIRSRLQGLMQEHARKALSRLEGFSTKARPRSYRELDDLISYNLNRSK